MKAVIAGALALAAGASSALAAVQSVSAPFALPLGGGHQQTLVLPAFDVSLGTLESVNITLNSTVSIRVAGENRNPTGNTTFSGSYSGWVTASGLPGEALTTTLAGLLPTQTVAPFGAESGFVYNPGLRSVSGSDGASFSGAEGPGLGNPVTITLRGDGSWDVFTSGSSTVAVTEFAATGNVTIEYGYAPVPTPAGVLALGLGGVVAARRRRA